MGRSITNAPNKKVASTRGSRPTGTIKAWHPAQVTGTYMGP